MTAAPAAQACESGIIRIAAGEAPQLDFLQGECTFCAACADVCPQPLFQPRDTEPLAGASASTAAVSLFLALTVAAAESCEQQAIRFRLMPNGIGQPEILPQHCTGCGACIAPCPVSATGLHHDE